MYPYAVITRYIVTIIMFNQKLSFGSIKNRKRLYLPSVILSLVLFLSLHGSVSDPYWFSFPEERLTFPAGHVCWINCHSFHLSENVFISPVPLKAHFAEYTILGWQLRSVGFSFQHFAYFPHSPACMASEEKSAITLVLLPLHNVPPSAHSWRLSSFSLGPHVFGSFTDRPKCRLFGI